MLVKKELLEIEPTKEPEKDAAGYFASAIVSEKPHCGKILAVFLWKGRELKYRGFLDEKNYITYREESAVWSQRNIFDNYTNVKSDKESDEIARDFLDEKWRYGNLKSMVRDRVRDINWHRREKTRDKKWERIRNAVNLLPKALPDSVVKWAEEKAFIHKSVILSGKTKTGRARIKCMACGRIHSVKKAPKYRSKYVCPRCGKETEITAEKYILCDSNKEKKRILFSHQEADSILLISATVFRRIKKNLRYKYWYDTNYFELKTPETVRKYKYNTLKYSWTDARYAGFEECIVHAKAIEIWYQDSVLGFDTALIDGRRIGVESFMRSLQSRRALTANLIRHGFINLAQDADILEDSNDFETVFGISKNYIHACRRWDIWYSELKILQMADCWVDDELFSRIRNITEKEGNVAYSLKKINGRMSLRKAIRYFGRQMETTGKTMRTLIDAWCDYVRMSEELTGKKLEKNYMFPKNLVKMHDTVSDQLQIKKNSEKDEAIRKLYELHHSEYEMHANGMRIIMPKGLENFIQEGRVLHHCIASGFGYIDGHIEGEKMSFFVREDKNPNKPYFTFTVYMQSKKLKECHGMNNVEPPAKVKKLIEQFIKRLEKSERKREVA